MKKETKSEIKETVLTGASSAAGTMAGVVIGAAVTAETVDAVGDILVEPDDEPIIGRPHAAHHEAPAVPVVAADEIDGIDVEVVGFDRVTTDDGSQIDVAVVLEDGEEVVYIDADLDGVADVRSADLNHNGGVDHGEVELVTDMNIDMNPFAEEAGFNPLYAQNDLPDYVNDANVDTYMA